MYFWFPRAKCHHSVAGSSRRLRPLVEQLESRNCPTSANVCVIATLSATAEPGMMVQINGTVQDLNPAACVVNFSGVVSGSVAVNSDGTFSAELPAATLGQVTAVGQDNQQQVTSVPVSTQVSAEPPEIENFAVVHVLNNTWTISGLVVDQSPAGLSVVFGGPGNIQNSTTPTDGNGNFSVAVVVTTNASDFTITATVTDAWGLTSQQVSYTCSNS